MSNFIREEANISGRSEGSSKMPPDANTYVWERTGLDLTLKFSFF